MVYPLIAIGLSVVLIVYLLYLLLIRKDGKAFRATLYPSLFFVAIWLVLYFAFLR